MTLRRGTARPLLLTVAAFGLMSQAARADPETRLEYFREPGTEECPAGPELEQEVAARLGHDPFGGRASSAFHTEIRAAEGKFVGQVTLVDAEGLPAGTRRFEAAEGHCQELVAAMALAISLAINPELSLAAEAPDRVPPAPVATGTQDESAPPPAVSKPAPARFAVTPASERAVVRQDPPDSSEGSLAVGIDGHGSMGLGPEPTLGMGLFARIRRGAVSVGLEGRFDAPVNHAVGDAAVYSRLLGGGVAPCFHSGVALGCAVLLVADVTASAEGVPRKNVETALYVGAGARVAAALPLARRLSLEARLEGLVSVRPVGIVFDDNWVWRAPLASGTVGLAGVAQWP